MSAMRIRLDYGRSGLDVDLPDGPSISVLEPGAATPLVDPQAAVAAALAAPIGAPPLAEVARGRRDAVVVISDKTRPIPYADVLPPVLATLEAAGIARQRIEILVATGLHRANTPAELAEMTSPAIVSGYRLRNHDARDAGAHVHCGRTTRGTEVWIDRGYVDADLKIITGLIEPHLMAGFSGGRKAVAPGLAAVETMRSLHGTAMLEDHLGPGILDDNPFHAELIGIARRVGVDCMVDVSINRRRQITGVFAGDLEAAHAVGAAAVERHVRADLNRPADIVITSAAGFPLDDTYYQAIKGLVAALNVVRRGGTIILAAAITEGLGSAEFQHLLRDADSPEGSFARISRPDFFSIDQWMLQHLCQVRRKAEVVVVSHGLPDRVSLAPFATRAASVEAALDAALAHHGRTAHVAVLPQGPYVLATVRGRKLSLGRAWADEAA